MGRGDCPTAPSSGGERHRQEPDAVLSLMSVGYSLVDNEYRPDPLNQAQTLGMSTNITDFTWKSEASESSTSARFSVEASEARNSYDFVLTLKDWDELENVDQIGIDRQV